MKAVGSLVIVVLLTVSMLTTCVENKIRGHYEPYQPKTFDPVTGADK